jgi:hypothetical protein
MRKAIVCLAFAAGMALAPTATWADDVQAQLQQMQDRMAELEDRLQATSDQLESANQMVMRQQEVIDRSGIADPSASSGVAAFLDTLEIGGWVAGSYWYNFNRPDGEDLGGANRGATGFAYPFHPDAESFSVDQLWFELERPIDEANRAGFRADIAFGKTADILSDGSEDGISGSQDDLQIYQAYAQYLAPIGSEGVTFKFGKFATLFGAEVAPTIYNWNVSRGNVYNLLQPITHVGILATMPFAEGFDASLGYVNEDVTAADVDINTNKGVLGRIGWSGEQVSVGLTGMIGSSQAPINAAGFPSGSLESDKEGIYDVVVTWDPTAELSTWLDFTYRTLELDQVPAAVAFFGEDDVKAWGVAVAGRYALTERLGLALRGEYLQDEDSFFTGLATGSFLPPGNETDLWSLTGTVDFALTEQLKLRGEVRYDTAELDGGFDDDEVFVGDDGDFDEDDQITAGVEVVYTF